jgi:hypothetical protein
MHDAFAPRVRAAWYPVTTFWQSCGIFYGVAYFVLLAAFLLSNDRDEYVRLHRISVMRDTRSPGLDIYPRALCNKNPLAFFESLPSAEYWH